MAANPAATDDELRALGSTPVHSGYDYPGQFERGLELILYGIEQLRHERQGG